MKNIDKPTDLRLNKYGYHKNTEIDLAKVVNNQRERKVIYNPRKHLNIIFQKQKSIEFHKKKKIDK